MKTNKSTVRVKKVRPTPPPPPERVQIELDMDQAKDLVTLLATLRNRKMTNIHVLEILQECGFTFDSERWFDHTEDKNIRMFAIDMGYDSLESLLRGVVGG